MGALKNKAIAEEHDAVTRLEKNMEEKSNPRIDNLMARYEVLGTYIKGDTQWVGPARWDRFREACADMTPEDMLDLLRRIDAEKFTHG